MNDNVSFIREKYNEVGHPIAFASPNLIYKYMKEEGRHVKIGEIRNILQEFDGYNLHKEYKRPRYFNPFYIYRRRKQVQGDLIEIRNLAKQNDGFNYIFLLVDSFSRKAWGFLLKTKTGKEVADVLKKHLEKSRDHSFHELLVDGGKEFFNKEVKNLLKQYGISIQLSGGYNKVAIVERLNKTMQSIIYKYLTHNETNRFIDEFDNFLQTYNNRPHRSLKGLTPNSADEKVNEVKVRGILRKKYFDVKRMTNEESETFKVGDIVRIKKLHGAISSQKRGYEPQYHYEFFTIKKIDKRFPRTMYYIKSMEDDEEVISGFYRSELSAVKGNIWKIKKIIKTRVKGGEKEHLVRWLYFSPKWDSWVKDADISSVFVHHGNDE